MSFTYVYKCRCEGTVGKIYAPIFSFFRKRVGIMISDMRPTYLNFTFYSGIHDFFNVWKNYSFLNFILCFLFLRKFCEMATTDQKTVIFFKNKGIFFVTKKLLLSQLFLKKITVFMTQLSLLRIFREMVTSHHTV